MKLYEAKSEVSWADKLWKPGEIAMSTTPPPESFKEVSEIPTEASVTGVEVQHGEPTITTGAMTKAEAESHTARAGSPTNTRGGTAETADTTTPRYSDTQRAQDTPADDAESSPAGDGSEVEKSGTSPPEASPDDATEGMSKYEKAAAGGFKTISQGRAAQTAALEFRRVDEKGAWSYYESTNRKGIEWAGTKHYPISHPGGQAVYTDQTPPDGFRKLSYDDLSGKMIDAIKVKEDKYGELKTIGPSKAWLSWMNDDQMKAFSGKDS